MGKRLLLSLALLAEIVAIVYLYGTYSEVEQNILNVQGQFQERYADLHNEWTRLAGGLAIIGLAIPFTIYFLVQSFRKPR